MTSFERVWALLDEHGLMTMTSEPPLPSLVETVAGEPVRGSWWAHAHGGEIFRIASELEDRPDVVVAKLVRGKVTFVHARLWPALFRVVTDGEWRRQTDALLSKAARGLLGAVQRQPPLRLDAFVAAAAPADRPALRKAKDELERRLVVQAAQVHTESGRHATVLSPWQVWAPVDLPAQAAALSLDEALATLREATHGLPLGVHGEATPLGRRTARRPKR